MDNPAPMGGLYINVTTDIPSSVIMPEVIIPETARTVNIAVQAVSQALEVCIYKDRA